MGIMVQFGSLFVSMSFITKKILACKCTLQLQQRPFSPLASHSKLKVICICFPHLLHLVLLLVSDVMTTDHYPKFYHHPSHLLFMAICVSSILFSAFGQFRGCSVVCVVCLLFSINKTHLLLLSSAVIKVIENVHTDSLFCFSHTQERVRTETEELN